MKQISSMQEPTLETDSAGISFLRIPVTFSDGTSFDWGLPAGDLDKLIGWFNKLNHQMIVEGSKSDDGAKPHEREAPLVGPIAVQAVGLGINPFNTAEREADILLVLELAGSRLALQMPHDQIAALGNNITRIQQMSSSSPLPN